MDILPTEEEQMLKNLAREFLEGECPPSLARAMETDDLGYPPELWKKMADLGWFGLSLPEQYGGQGMPLTYLGFIMEEARNLEKTIDEVKAWQPPQRSGGRRRRRATM